MGKNMNYKTIKEDQYLELTGSKNDFINNVFLKKM